MLSPEVDVTKEDDRYTTATDVLREYAQANVEVVGGWQTREEIAEAAFAALRDILAMCDAALPDGRAAREALSVRHVRTLIRENIRKAS
jgi:hypothetical protein